MVFEEALGDIEIRYMLHAGMDHKAVLDSGEPVETIISGLIDSDEFKALMGE